MTNGRAEQVILQNDMGYDKVTFFDTAGGDRLVVSRSAFGLTGSAAWVDTTDSPEALVAGPAFIYESSTQILWFDHDGAGDIEAPIAVAGFYGLTSGAPTATDLIFGA